jgi:hypothetical protein
MKFTTDALRQQYGSYYSNRNKKGRMTYAQFSSALALSGRRDLTRSEIVQRVEGITIPQVRKLQTRFGLKRTQSIGLQSNPNISRPFIYMTLVLGLPINRTAELLNVSLDTAIRLRKALLKPQIRKKLKLINKSKSRAHPERGLMRILITRKDPNSNKYLYSLKFLAKLWGVDIDTLITANNFPPRIRQPTDLRKGTCVSSKPTQWPELLLRAKRELASLRKKPPIDSTKKTLFQLKQSEKEDLYKRMLIAIDSIPYHKSAEEKTSASLLRLKPIIKETVTLLMKTPGYWLSSKELKTFFSEKNYSKGDYRRALNLISEEGIGLLVCIGRKIVAINPEVTSLLIKNNY